MYFFCWEHFVRCHILSLLYTCVILYRCYHSSGYHPKSWIFLPSSNITRATDLNKIWSHSVQHPQNVAKKQTFRKEQYTHDWKKSLYISLHPSPPSFYSNPFQRLPPTYPPTNLNQPPPLADDSALRQHRIPVRRSHQPPVLVGSHLGGVQQGNLQRSNMVETPATNNRVGAPDDF